MNTRSNAPKVSNRVRVTNTIWDIGCYRFNLLAGPFKIVIRFIQLGFNIHDLFFIRFFKLKDSHYKNDIIPILQHLRNMSTALSPHVDLRSRSFHNMFVNVIQEMQQIDNKSMARCHLQAYHYSDYRAFEIITKDVRRYNDMVQVFINHVTERIELYLKIELPYLRKYSSSEELQSNYYHYNNIVFYFWLVYWQSRDGKIETQPEIVHYGNAHYLRINTSGEPIASADNDDDIRKLHIFLTTLAPDVVDWLTRLNTYRNEVVGHLNTFIQNIEHILDDHSWNKSIKGTCGWERGFRSLS